MARNFYLEQMEEERKRSEKYFKQVLVLAEVRGALMYASDKKRSHFSKETQAFAAELLNEIKTKLESLE